MMETHASRVRAIFCRALDAPDIVSELQRFRKRLFIDHSGWDLETTDGREIDQFDRPGTSHCALYVGNVLVGGFRAIRTDSPYLGKSVFPQLASIREYPSRRDAWEITRFGILPDYASESLARLNYGLMFLFAETRQATSLVAIADLTYERYLRAIGIRTRRYGPPQIIGKDRCGRDHLCVAGEIPVTDQSATRVAPLLALTHSIEVHDATLVRRSTAISA